MRKPAAKIVSSAIFSWKKSHLSWLCCWQWLLRNSWTCIDYYLLIVKDKPHGKIMYFNMISSVLRGDSWCGCKQSVGCRFCRFLPVGAKAPSPPQSQRLCMRTLNPHFQSIRSDCNIFYRGSHSIRSGRSAAVSADGRNGRLYDRFTLCIATPHSSTVVFQSQRLPSSDPWRQWWWWW